MSSASSDTSSEPAAPTAAASPRVSGRLSGRASGGGRRALLVLFGIVYFQQLGRLLAWLFGRRARVELSLSDTAVRARRSSSLLGVALGESEEVYPFAGLSRVQVERTASGTFLWAGGALFVAGVALACVLAFRSRVGFGGALAFAALAFVMLGLALDVGAYALVQRYLARGLARVEVAAQDGRYVGVSGVPRDEAQRFVDEVERRLPKARRE